MDSANASPLPIFDLSDQKIIPGTDSWFSMCKNIQNALEEYGCFIAKYDKVSSQLHKVIFDRTLIELFELPKEVKARNTSDIAYYGYVSPRPGFDLYESLGIGDSTAPGKIQDFTTTMWPAGNDHFCETVQSYTNLVSELEQKVKRMVFQSYGVEKHYAYHDGSTAYLLRFMKYTEAVGDTNTGIAPHTDKSILTILDQNQVDGLEVQTRDGKWISISYPPSSYVVMAGEGFWAWSNGRIHAPLHRVIMRKGETRYSTAQFSFHKGILEVPQEFVDDDHPLLFKPFDHIALLNVFGENPSQMSQQTAKVHAGM